MKKLWIILSVIAVIILGAILYLKTRKSTDFEPLIKAKLQQLVKDGSNGLYVLDMDKIEVDVLNSKVTVHNARLLIDSARLKVLIASGIAPVDVYKISLSDLAIDGLNISDLLDKKNIDLDELKIKNPVFEIYHPVNKKDTAKKDTATLYSLIQKSLGHFHLKNLAISNMNFVYHNITNQQEKLTKFQNVSMKFSDLQIDSLTQFDTTRFLYAKDALIWLPEYSLRTPDSLYIFKTDTLELHAAQRFLEVKNLSLNPRGDKQAFSKKLKLYKDRYDIHFAKASFKNIDWYQLFLGEGFTAHEGNLNNGTMEIYANRNIPPSSKSKVGNFPHQLLMKLNLPVAVDVLNINNFKLTYQEVNPKTQQTGTLVFDKVDGVITNITNIKENIVADKFMKVKAQSYIMNKGRLDAVFTFDLTKTKDGSFTVDANLGPMDGTAFNPVCMPLGLFEINSIAIKKLKTHITGNSYIAHSSTYFVYDDLKITALKAEGDNKKLKSRKFLSFIANTFIVNKSNTSVKETSTPQQATFKRDTTRSFFFLVWKSIFEGLAGIVK